MSSESRVHPLPKLNLAPDAPIDAIPGVGLVRARSLRKAGWLDVAALRTARLNSSRLFQASPRVRPRSSRSTYAIIRRSRPSSRIPLAPIRNA